MSEDDVCGYEDTTTGNPCEQPAGENGRCHIPSHNPGPDNDNPGRPSKLSKDIVDQVTRHIAEGKSDAEAFRKASLHPSTKGNWLQRIDDPENVPLDPDFDDDPYGYFFRRYTHARGLGEEWYTDNIMDMILDQGDIEAAMAMMKQRYGESWGDVDRGEQAGGVIVNLGNEQEYTVDPETLEVTDAEGA